MCAGHFELGTCTWRKTITCSLYTICMFGKVFYWKLPLASLFNWQYIINKKKLKLTYKGYTVLMPSPKGTQNHVCRICTKIGRRRMSGKGGWLTTTVGGKQWSETFRKWSKKKRATEKGSNCIQLTVLFYCSSFLHQYLRNPPLSAWCRLYSYTSSQGLSLNNTIKIAR